MRRGGGSGSGPGRSARTCRRFDHVDGVAGYRGLETSQMSFQHMDF
jgi:hypothetical protein